MRSLDDLRIASHKVEDVEGLIREQDWKIKHSTIDSHLTFLFHVGMVTTALTLLCAIVAVLDVAVNGVLDFKNGGRTIIHVL
jgi:hypothetical protein